MIFKFLLVSDEVADFKREIQIDGDDTFFDLHKIIMKCSSFEETEMTAFFMCDDWWKRKQQITLVEMDTDSDEDSLVMEDETLSDWLDEEKQKLMFVFDYSEDRVFYMELSEIIPRKNLSKPICTKKSGEAPAQFLKEEEEEIEIVKPVIPSPEDLIDDEDDDLDDDDLSIEEDDETFYGEDDFNPDELDMNGFESVDGADADLNIPDDSDLV